MKVPHSQPDSRSGIPPHLRPNHRKCVLGIDRHHRHMFATTEKTQGGISTTGRVVREPCSRQQSPQHASPMGLESLCCFPFALLLEEPCLKPAGCETETLAICLFALLCMFKWLSSPITDSRDVHFITHTVVGRATFNHSPTHHRQPPHATSANYPQVIGPRSSP